MSDVKFISGLTFKAPHEKAPSYIMARGSIKREDLIAWLGTEQGEWINFDVKVSQNGKWYEQWTSGSRPSQAAPAPAEAVRSSASGRRGLRTMRRAMSLRAMTSHS